MIWSIDPVRSLTVDMRLAGLFLAALALAAAADRIITPQRIALFVLAGITFGVVLAWFELASDGELIKRISVRGFAPYRLDQIAIGLVILGPAVTAWLILRGWLAPALIIATADLDDRFSR